MPESQACRRGFVGSLWPGLTVRSNPVTLRRSGKISRAFINSAGDFANEVGQYGQSKRDRGGTFPLGDHRLARPEERARGTSLDRGARQGGGGAGRLCTQSSWPRAENRTNPYAYGMLPKETHGYH